MNLIAAVSRNWGLGKDNELLFHIKQDMKHFRELTTGHVVVMGRKTLDSFPGGKPLKNRVNIVLTRDKDFEREGAVAVHDKEELLSVLKNYDDGEIFVIGGGEIYAMLLPYCKTAYITLVDAEPEADTFLHCLHSDSDWHKEQTSPDYEDGSLTYRFVTYVRKS